MDELCWIEKLLTVLREVKGQNPTAGYPVMGSLPPETLEWAGGGLMAAALAFHQREAAWGVLQNFVLLDQRETFLFSLVSRF